MASKHIWFISKLENEKNIYKTKFNMDRLSKMILAKLFFAYLLQGNKGPVVRLVLW
jgi:hypothetical protein